MNEIMNIEIGGITLRDVAMSPEKYPDEILAAYIDVSKSMTAQIREAQQIMEANLLKRMDDENATKLVFKNLDGAEMMATRKKGSVKCEAKNADEIMKANGFDPLAIGEYKFSPSWTKAKEARKLGGEMQVVIDDLFKEGRESIMIGEK